jgi:integration host factor subunit beta
MATITKKELIDCITERTQTKQAMTKSVIQSFLNGIITELASGNRLEFRGFGVFEIRNRAARIAQNPKTMEKVQIPAKRTVKFKMGRLMAQKMNGQKKGMAQICNIGQKPTGKQI